MNTPIVTTTRNTLTGIVLAAAAMAGNCHGQNTRQQVRVDVPFAFQDGVTHLNSGVYTMALEDGSLMLLRGARDSRSTLSLISQDENTAPAPVSKAVFHKYGDQYFLREVWVAGSSMHIDIPSSKAEKSLQKELQLAANQPTSTGTVVALLELPR